MPPRRKTSRLGRDGETEPGAPIDVAPADLPQALSGSVPLLPPSPSQRPLAARVFGWTSLVAGSLTLIAAILVILQETELVEHGTRVQATVVSVSRVMGRRSMYFQPVMTFAVDDTEYGFTGEERSYCVVGEKIWMVYPPGQPRLAEEEAFFNQYFTGMLLLALALLALIVALLMLVLLFRNSPRPPWAQRRNSARKTGAQPAGAETLDDAEFIAAPEIVEPPAPSPHPSRPPPPPPPAQLPARRAPNEEEWGH